jgi:hypothetical protein
MSTISFVTQCAGLGALFGALVALPAPAAPGRLERLRSSAWALVLPGMLVAGTFGVLALPAAPTALATFASLATPALAAVAVVAIVRGRSPWLLIVPPALLLAATRGGWAGELAGGVVTALGCLTLGNGLVRLTPARALVAGMIGMCGVDVLLLSTNVGEHAGAVLADATPARDLPDLQRAHVGSISTDYPDLFLAAVIGSLLAGRRVQRRVAVAAAALSAAWASGLAFVDHPLPATVPLALALVVIAGWPVRERVAYARGKRRRSRPRGDDDPVVFGHA